MLGLMNRSLVKAGNLTQEHPKRFYNYALLDPLDKPFASFRYFPRTWGEPHLLLPSQNWYTDSIKTNSLP